MSRRIEKINQAVLESVSSTILFSLRDPRIRNVTVTRVETAPDTRTAKVYVSVLGDEGEQRLCLHGLESARGFLQKKVADRIETRFTPVLTFLLDQGVKKSVEASKLIREARADGIALPGDPLPGNVPFGARSRDDESAAETSPAPSGGTTDATETDATETDDPTRSESEFETRDEANERPPATIATVTTAAAPTTAEPVPQRVAEHASDDAATTEPGTADDLR